MSPAKRKKLIRAWRVKSIKEPSPQYRYTCLVVEDSLGIAAKLSYQHLFDISHKFADFSNPYKRTNIRAMPNCNEIRETMLCLFMEAAK